MPQFRIWAAIGQGCPSCKKGKQRRCNQTVPGFVCPISAVCSGMSGMSGLQNPNNVRVFAGWGTWIRTRTDGVRVRCSTVKLFPIAKGWRPSPRRALASCRYIASALRLAKANDRQPARRLCSGHLPIPRCLLSLGQRKQAGAVFLPCARVRRAEHEQGRGCGPSPIWVPPGGRRRGEHQRLHDESLRGLHRLRHSHSDALTRKK